jgi:nucleoside-diphosphate-sugar epimerase
MKILITGYTGFVGNYISKNFTNKNYIFFKLNLRQSNHLSIPEDLDVFLHLAGKAHDLKNVSKPNEYYHINTDITKIIFDSFLDSSAKIFIILSSVKAVADLLNTELTEDYIPNPMTHYGRSKLLAEEYILSKKIPEDKRVYILRPCMIHGPGNKGNLNQLYKFVKKGIPWPLGSFDNKRSFCSIDNLCFIINELIENELIPSGIYNIADDEPVSSNELIKLISESQYKVSRIWNIPPIFIKILFRLGDLIKLPFNTERLNKLTENYIVSNNKIKNAIKKPLPINSKNGLINTFNSFNSNV